MSQKHFCTLFDSGYLLKGLAMIRSLERHEPEAVVHVLCMDPRSQDILEALHIPSVRCIPLAEIETKELLAAKQTRGVAEYCWTLSPSLPWHILQQNPEIGFITYLDSDLMFYAPVDPILAEIGESSIGIIEHRFSPRLKAREINGRFCVEWVSFRRDDEGMACLDRWRRQCIEWCYYRLEDGKFGDQKYLDEWPGRYRHCHVIAHPGAGVAPWNYPQYEIGVEPSGHISVDGAPLIFYHFHQFTLLDDGGFDRLSSVYTVERPEPDAVYAAYEFALTAALAEVRAVAPGFAAGLKPTAQVARRRWVQRFVPQAVKNLLRNFIRY